MTTPLVHRLSRIRPKETRAVALILLSAMACFREPAAPNAGSGAAAAADSPASPQPGPALVAPNAALSATPAPAFNGPRPSASVASPPSPSPSETPEPAPTLPTLPVRPSAAPSGLAARVAPLVAKLASFVKQQGGELGFSLYDLGNGRELSAEGADLALNPASNQKILTAAVALSELGPEHRFHVGLYGAIENGIAPRLVLRGDGDPSFSYAELRALAERVVALGLREITGPLLLDQSAFDQRYVPPAFEQQPREWSAFRAPVSAVSLDGNAITLHVYPTTVGKPARVEFEPPGYVAVTGEVRTDNRKQREHVGLTLEPNGVLLRAEVAGGIPEGSNVLHALRRIDNPELYAGLVLKKVLSTLGVKADGPVTLGGDDEPRELSGRDSAPLRELCQRLGKASDNFYAETLLKAVGARYAGKPGTSEQGVRALFAWLSAQQIAYAGLTLQNGSGLYDANRLSARSLTRALAAGYFDPRISSAFVEQLAVGGVDGTLRARFTAARGRRSIHAKTGTLNRAIALSGFVFGPNRETGVAFSLLVTGIAGQHGELRKRMDALVSEVDTALAQASSKVASIRSRAARG